MRNPFEGCDMTAARILDVKFAQSGDIGGRVQRYPVSTGFYQFGWKLSGKTDIIYGDRYLAYHAGTLLYLPKESRTDIRYDKTYPEPGCAICIFFDTDGPMPDKAFTLPYGELGLPAAPLHRMLDDYRAFIRKGDRGNGYAVLADFYGLMASLESALDKAETAASGAERLAPAVRYIEDHFTEPYIDGEILARLASMTPEYFRHCFTRAYRMPPLRYIIRRRLAYSVELLTSGDLSVGEVARLAGFESPNYFARAFRQHTGMSPTEYRGRYGTTMDNA